VVYIIVGVADHYEMSGAGLNGEKLSNEIMYK